MVTAKVRRLNLEGHFATTSRANKIHGVHLCTKAGRAMFTVSATFRPLAVWVFLTSFCMPQDNRLTSNTTKPGPQSNPATDPHGTTPPQSPGKEELTQCLHTSHCVADLLSDTRNMLCCFKSPLSRGLSVGTHHTLDPHCLYRVLQTHLLLPMMVRGSQGLPFQVLLHGATVLSTLLFLAFDFDCHSLLVMLYLVDPLGIPHSPTTSTCFPCYLLLM